MMIKDKTILITGSTKGIGLAIAKYAVKLGAKVIITGRKDRSEYIKSDHLTNEFFDNKNVMFFQCDLSDINEIKKLKEALELDFITIDILVNNAGTTVVKDFFDMTIEDFDELNNINYRSVFAVTNTFLPEIIQNKGAIVNILSVAVFKSFEKNSLYAASKSAVQSMMKILREEQRENEVDVVNVYPGATATELWPEDMRINNQHKMMMPEHIGKAVTSVINDIINNKLTVEEIVLRPKSGDI